MGGVGSGRKPDPVKALTQVPIASYGEELVVLPDYSGVSSHAKTVAAFDDRYHNVNENVIPSADNTLNVGSASFRYNTAYVSDVIGWTPQVYHFQGGRLSPADSTTYYIGGLFALAPSTTANIARIVIQKAGTITRCNICFNNGGTLGSGETFSAYLRVNNTNDYLISSNCTTNTAWQYQANTNMNISVSASDTVEVKIIFPAYVTNPTNVMVYGTFIID